MPKALRRTLLALTLGALPMLAAAAGNYPSGTSQPSAATPSTPPTTATQNSVNRSGNSDYGQAIAACEQKPMSERVACRQAADTQYGKAGGDTSGNTTSGNAAGNAGTTGASSATGAGATSGSSSSSGTGTSGGPAASGGGTGTGK